MIYIAELFDVLQSIVAIEDTHGARKVVGYTQVTRD